MKVGDLVEVDFVDMTGVGTGTSVCGLVVDYSEHPTCDEVCVMIDDNKHWFYLDEVRIVSEHR